MHGGNLRWAQETYGRDSFIDLSANINPFGPPKLVWQVLKQSLPEIVRYPDPDTKSLCIGLSQRFNLPIENIMTGNGAGELIFTIVQALKPLRVLIPVPAFSEYERAARAVTAEIKQFHLGAKGWGSLPCISSVEGKEEFTRIWRGLLQGVNLLFLCSPHNPTGSVLSREQLELILQIAQELNSIVIVDESFFDFLPDTIRFSAREFLGTYNNLIVLYSMTKFYSLPGLRLGAAFAASPYISRFKEYRDPWTVNVLAEKAGVVSLQDKHFAEEIRQRIEESKTFFCEEFLRRNFTNMYLYPSLVNFALIEISDRSSSELVTALGHQGILVRDCANFPGLNGNFIRTAIKEKDNMKKLIEALQSII